MGVAEGLAREIPTDVNGVRIKYGTFNVGRSFYDMPEHPPGVLVEYEMNGQTRDIFYETTGWLNVLFPATFPPHVGPVKKAEQIAERLKQYLESKGINATIEKVFAGIY